MIDLSRLPLEGLRTKGRLVEFHLQDGPQVRDLDWEVFLLPSNRDVFLDIQGRGILECTCSRCLEPFDLALSFATQFLGTKDADLVIRGNHTLGSQDLDVVHFPEDFLEEEALVREQVQLQVPMHPLCKDDCEGLCPECGKNWNKGRCSCRPEFNKEPSALAKALSGLKLNLDS